jgi:uncharacterized protein (DUF1015 family)
MRPTASGGSSRRHAITDIRPFRALRYDPAVVRGDEVIAPPYDVVSEQDVRDLHARSPENVAHVESPRDADGDRYAGAAAALERWQAEGALRRDDRPACYVYEQRFTAGGAVRTRRVCFARMRLHPSRDGQVRPHESTMAGPKRDRLELMRATGANVSPILAMYRDPAGDARAVLDEAAAGPPAFEAAGARGDEHRLWVIDDPRGIETLTAALAASTVTIADGHHRWETARAYHAQRGDDASGWMLAGLVAVEEPGLLILPNHRLVQVGRVPADFVARLSALYEVEDITPKSWDGTAVQRLWGRVQANATGPPTFGVLGIEDQRLHVVTARSAAAIDRAMPQDWSAASRALDVNVLTETILGPLLGLDADALAAGERVAFTEDVEEAWRRTERTHNLLAFLINPTRVEQVLAVADAGELMPQKATFFYPKLATGLVINLID